MRDYYDRSLSPHPRIIKIVSLSRSDNLPAIFETFNFYFINRKMYTCVRAYIFSLTFTF